MGLALGLLAALAPAAAGLPAGLPELSAIPLPAGVSVRGVLDDAAIDGHRFALRQLHSALDCDALWARVRQHWRGHLSPHLLAQPLAHGRVLSAALPDGFINLHLQPGPTGACEALLSRWPLGTAAPTQGQEGPGAMLRGLPASVSVLRHTVERRAGAVTGIITAQSALPLARLLSIVRAEIQAQGYQIQPSDRAPGAAPLRSAVLAARKAGTELTVFLNTTADVTDVVLIHEERSP